MSARLERRPRATIAAAVGLAALLVSCRAPGPEPVATEPDARGASSTALAESVDILRARRQWGEALLVLQRLERLEPRRSPVLQIVFATTLHNAALDGRMIEGVPIAATRSAVERVAMDRDAIRRYERAEADSADLGLHSRIAALRAGPSCRVRRRRGYPPSRTRRMVSGIPSPAPKMPRSVPATLERPARRTRWRTGISAQRSPARAARACISTVQP